MVGRTHLYYGTLSMIVQSAIISHPFRFRHRKLDRTRLYTDALCNDGFGFFRGLTILLYPSHGLVICTKELYPLVIFVEACSQRLAQSPVLWFTDNGAVAMVTNGGGARKVLNN